MSGMTLEHTGALVTVGDAGAEAGSSVGQSSDEARLEILVARHAILVQELASTRDTLKFEQQKNEKLLAALNRMQGENSAYRELMDNQGRVGDELSDLTLKVTALSTKIDSGAMRSSDDRTAESLRLITSSFSWRVTRPLRAIRSIMIRRFGF